MFIRIHNIFYELSNIKTKQNVALPEMLQNTIYQTNCTRVYSSDSQRRYLLVLRIYVRDTNIGCLLFTIYIYNYYKLLS